MEKIKRYYIIDDDEDDQQFLVEALTENDRSVQYLVASDCQEALNDLKKGTDPLPDAIFLDLNMPRLNGRQCLAELKRTPSLQHIPVIIYSTSSHKEEILETMQMGAWYFLIKKSSFGELCEELSSMITALDGTTTVGA